MEYKHVSVLLDEALEGLNIKPTGIYADGTLGGGGHSRAILERLSPDGKLVAIDRDEFALSFAKEVLADWENVCYVKNNFSNIQAILDDLSIEKINGMILDLGVSSFQLDDAQRGFSYMQDAPLDMRMDKKQRVSAYDIINEYSEEKLKEIIYRYGEEKWAKRIVEFIIEKRRTLPIETTFELVDVIKAAIPKKPRMDGPHPAKRTFQAIRIEVNGELDMLEQAINDIVDRLDKNGRIAVITFHSLEDRIVKETFKNLENPCVCPRELPICVCGKKPQVKIITKKPIISSSGELENNPRSRSAKLRIAQKI